MSDKYEWVEFYKELASKLIVYKDNRAELVAIVRKIYELTGINFPTLEKDKNLVDIDPFTFYGLFNKQITLDNRIKIATAIASLLDISTPVPHLFDGLPVLNNQNATYYYFLPGRGDDDIDKLWALFVAALKYEKDKVSAKEEIINAFNKAIKLPGIGNSKMTMALYWIAPETFLNLDSRSEWYIYKSGKIPAEIVAKIPTIESKIPAEKYFSIVETVQSYLSSGALEGIKDFCELSFDAWKYSEEINKQQREDKKKAQRDDTSNALADNDVETTHYWMYSPGDNASNWDACYEAGIMTIGWGSIGDLTQYKSKDDMKIAMRQKIDENKSFKNAAHATWQFVNEMKPGDIVFAKKGLHQIIGKGVVTSDYYYDSEVEGSHKNIRSVDWTDKGVWPHPSGQAAMKTLTDITAYTDYVEQLLSLFKDDNDEEVEVIERTYPKYDSEQFLEEVYMDKANYDTLVGLLKIKKNVILQGAPGVGKTFAAKRLAYSIIGEKNQDRVMLVQFHQSYSYEDFIEGFRPAQNGGFEIKKGSFYKFCKKAEEDADNDYFFIIDEINRGNLSKIFGELFMLIENDKRGNSLQLLYSDEKFFVPKNVYIIGMMNTADRSLALLDYALRRRFAFFDMRPGFNMQGFCEYRDSLNSPKFNKLLSVVDSLNVAITDDESLGEGFCIGHSYFCQLTEVTDAILANIVTYELIPLIKEYWFDEPQKVKEWSDNLWRAIS